MEDNVSTETTEVVETTTAPDTTDVSEPTTGTEELVPGVPTEETQETPTEEPQPFDPDNVEFALEEAAGYELGQYEFGDDVIQGLQPTLDRAREAGISQEHLDFFLGEILNDEPVAAPNPMEILREGLTTEEKRNYKTVNNFVGNKFSEVPGVTKEQVNAKMQDPVFIKMMNHYIKGNNSSASQVPVEKAEPGYSVEEAKAAYKKYIRTENFTREERQGYIKDLINRTNDPDAAAAHFKGYM